MKKLIIYFVLFFMNTSVVLADEVPSNIKGLVIKDLKCDVNQFYKGNIVNRSNQTISGLATVHSYDSDGDPIGQCKSRVDLGPKSGNSFYASVCNCYRSKSVKIEVE